MQNGEAGLSLTMTIGEAIIKTSASTENIFTQGFNQPLNLLNTGIISQQSDGITVNAFPNPFDTEINLSLQSDKRDQFNVDIFDLAGRKVMPSQVLSHDGGISSWTLKTSELPFAIYIVSVKTMDGKIAKTFRLTRIN